ncbi:MAG: hypothetical protein Q7U05_06890 [Polaromonas sp.]|nr:hypothetical protein [Polaromonas sp.]
MQMALMCIGIHVDAVSADMDLRLSEALSTTAGYWLAKFKGS